MMILKASLKRAACRWNAHGRSFSANGSGLPSGGFAARHSEVTEWMEGNVACHH
jgi:hypothetical protein